MACGRAESQLEGREEKANRSHPQRARMMFVSFSVELRYCRQRVYSGRAPRKPTPKRDSKTFASFQGTGHFLVTERSRCQAASVNMISLRIQQTPVLIQPRHHLIFCQGLETRRLEVQALRSEARTYVGRDELLVEVGCNGEFWRIALAGGMESGVESIPCRVKLKSAGRSRKAPFGWRESGRRVPGSLNSSKKGCTMASIADRRWVGVYSNSFEIRSIALGSAFRKTCPW